MSPRKRTSPQNKVPAHVLVTGSHGFLGSAFVTFLIKKGIPHTLYDRTNSAPLPHDFDTVVHFGGITPQSKKNVSAAEYYDANVVGTEKLLHAIRGNPNLKRIISIGSAAEYGLSPRVIRESSPAKPVGEYGVTKLAQAKLIEAFSKETGVRALHLRIFNIAGVPHASSQRQSSIFEALLQQFEHDFTGTITLSNRRTVRDFVDIDDVMEAVVKALEDTRTKGFDVVNICSGKGTSLGTLTSTMGTLLHKKYRLKDESKKISRSVGSADKAKKLLAWEATTPLLESVTKLVGKREHLLIVGAGVAGHMVLEQINKEERNDIVVVGFVDDDPKKQGKQIEGARVLGTIADLPRILQEHPVDHIVISTPSVGGELIGRVRSAVPAEISIKILPSISSVILGNVDLSYIRDIDPSDLIGRPLVKSDQQFISRKAAGKTFLITGGAGSIGSEIVRQLYDSDAREVIIMDSWEEGVFNLLDELAARKNGTTHPRVRAYIGNVRDKARVEEIMKAHRINVVLHAAAYKHVPLMEDNAEEAHKTNVVGTKTVLNAALKYKVKEFVLISTDKAVHPSSVMGKTKRAAELFVKAQAKKHPGSRLCAVRFGNVLNSSGSVLPKFLKQIRSRSPVTITHMEMTRYFMSIPEAVSLVLMSWIVAKNGQILLLDMGKPVKIVDLAVSLIKIHGLEPYKDVAIEETGIRPGEKIHEELSYSAGSLPKSPDKRIFIAESI